MGMVLYLRRASDTEIAALASSPAEIDDFVWDAADTPDLIDFDKAWHALHFMLTGNPLGSGHPLGIILGEAPVLRPEQPGEAIAWHITPAAMAACHSALEALDDAALAARYDPAAMMTEELYLADAFAEEGDDALDYVMQGVPALRRFAAICAARGDGAVRLLV